MINQPDDADEYAPLVATYNAYSQAACNVDVERQATLDRFYRPSSALGVEFLVRPVGRDVHGRRSDPTDRRPGSCDGSFQSRFGDDAVQLWLSETHLVSRGNLRNLNGYVRQQYRKANLHYDGDVDRAALRARIDVRDGATLLEEADIEAADSEGLRPLFVEWNRRAVLLC